MAISSKILSQVPVEDEFSSTSSRHILVEDGGIIKWAKGVTYSYI